MKLPISDIQGKKLGEFDLDEKLLVFDKGQSVLHQAVVTHRANRRVPTASTLGKGEVRGTGAKPWKQKGLGRARAGYRQSNVWRGGSVVFGPKPRSFRKKMSKKANRLAFRRAFSEKVAAGSVAVIDRIELSEPKTKMFVGMLDSLKVEATALFVVDNIERNLALASRNVPGIGVTTAKRVNTYELLRYPQVFVSKAAMADLEQRLGAPAGNKS